MSCTLIGLLNIKDAEAFDEYRLAVPETLKNYQGRVLGRGPLQDTFANENQLPEFDAVAVIEFPNLELAQQWAHGPEYQSILAVRNKGISLTLRAFGT